MSADASTKRYRIVHTTQYDYSEPVAVSHHVARLTPRTSATQVCEQHEFQTVPPAALVRTHEDYYGNAMTFFAMQTPHTTLTLRVASTVSVKAPAVPAPSGEVPWERAADRTTMPLEALEFVLDFRSGGSLNGQVETYARRSFPPGRPLLEALADLTGRIHADFTYDREATTISTSLSQVFESRRGVCQDFAHLEIACLRSLGIPARYVSGYLETVPPPGKPRLVGADASHAWLAAFCGERGWVDVDPTNNVFPSTTHTALAWGRDYADVSPTRGVILGGGTHTLTVSVDVTRADKS